MSEKIRVDENIIVRPITMEDTDMVVRWRQNPRVLQNFLYRGPFTAEIHRNWMETKVASGEVIQFIIEENENPVGSVYYRDIDADNRTAEYGIFIGDDEAVGHGVGSKIAAWAVGYAKNVLHTSVLKLRALADNTAAVKSYEKAGYKVYDKTEDYIDGRTLLFMKVDFDEV